MTPKETKEALEMLKEDLKIMEEVYDAEKQTHEYHLAMLRKANGEIERLKDERKQTAEHYLDNLKDRQAENKQLKEENERLKKQVAEWKVKYEKKIFSNE